MATWDWLNDGTQASPASLLTALSNIRALRAQTTQAWVAPS